VAFYPASLAAEEAAALAAAPRGAIKSEQGAFLTMIS